jgi:hypothetical protein
LFALHTEADLEIAGISLISRERIIRPRLHGNQRDQIITILKSLRKNMSEKQTLGFQAEVKQLLQLMIHSLYSNKEIFLRELISNASDASDKLRFEAINNAALYEDDPELSIKVSFDKAARTITISDNGIGMSKEDAIAHLGTIAKSGTKEFFGKLSGDQQKDAAMIGQFGVGFIPASSSPTASPLNPAAQACQPAKACAGNLKVKVISVSKTSPKPTVVPTSFCTYAKAKMNSCRHGN